MTAQQFRRLALQLPEVRESAHCGHPDFRVGAGKKPKVLASLSPDETTANVKLTPAEQADLMRATPGVVAPCVGRFGEWGWTQITLRSAKTGLVRGALVSAWRNSAPAALLRTIDAAAE